MGQNSTDQRSLADPTKTDADRYVARWPPRLPYRRPASGVPLDAGHRIHLGFNEIVHNRHRRRGRPFALASRIASWPPRALGQSVSKTLRVGPTIRARTGKGLLRQWLEQLVLIFGSGIPSGAYYLFRLYDPERRAEAEQYLHRFETKNHGVYLRLNRQIGKSDHAFKFKRQFHERCLERGLPAPALFFHIHDGQAEAVEAKTQALPPVDLIVKPATGKGGRGVERWDWVPGAGFRSPEGEQLSAEALFERLVRMANSKEDLLVQQRAVNHPDLADLTQGALTTVRVLGCWDEQRRGEPTVAVFRMAVDSSTVDNIHAGGIACPVELSTGLLGSAVALDPRSERVERHPRTGAAIAGRKLPYWSEVLALVRDAHHAFPDHVIAGWDIGITADGPVLIEGNSNPCVNLIQRPHDSPLGKTRFAELMAYHLEQNPHRDEDARS